MNRFCMLIILGLLFLIIPKIGLEAASFDCSKATTASEKEICNDPELSDFDKKIANVYFSIEKSGRYYAQIVENQMLWIREKREIHGYDFGRQLWYLKMMSTINDCSKGDATFENCYPKALELYTECQEEGSYTTYIMNRCGSSLRNALFNILQTEASLWRQINSYDTETLELFDIAAEKWNNFVDADCKWQYSEYRDGTIRNQIWLSCSIRHAKARIELLNSSNRFQGKDITFLKDVN